MQQGIGIHLEQDQGVIAVVEQHADKLIVSQLLERENQTDLSTIEHLAELFHKNGLNPYNVAISIPARLAMFRKFNVPFSNKHDIEQILSYETEQYIQDIPIEELAVDYHILKAEPPNSLLLTAAIQKELIAQTISAIESYHIYPQAVDIDLMGLWYFVQTNPTLSSLKNIILMDVHHHVCNLLVVSEGQLLELRSLLVKFDVDITDSTSERPIKSMAQTLKTPILSKTVMLREGFRKTEILKLGLKAKVFLHIVKEIRRTVLPTHSPTAVYLCGEPDLLEYLPTFLERRLKIPVVTLEVASYFEIAPEISRPLSRAPIAIGLALKVLGKTQGGFNFRKGTFQYKRNFDLIKKPLAFTVTLLLLFSLEVGFYLHQLVQKQRQEYEQLLSLAEKIYARLAKQESFANISYWQKIYHVRDKVKTILSQSHDPLPAINDTILLWPTLFQQVDTVRQQYYFTVEHLTISQEEAILEGFTENDLVFDALKTTFRQISWVDQHEDAVRLLSKKPVEAKDSLSQQYKFLVRFKNKAN